MGRRLLVVDDDASIRNLFDAAFSDAGYRTHVAADADEAIAILSAYDIDLIFLDLRLFGMNGIELCRRIRQRNPLAIVYAITGWSGLFEVGECREAGFDDYFIKPVRIEILLQAAENAYAKLDRWKNGRIGATDISPLRAPPPRG